MTYLANQGKKNPSHKNINHHRDHYYGSTTFRRVEISDSIPRGLLCSGLFLLTETSIRSLSNRLIHFIGLYYTFCQFRRQLAIVSGSTIQHSKQLYSTVLTNPAFFSEKFR